MSEISNDPPVSPDYLEISSAGKGTKRLNNVPRAALMSIVSFVTLAFVYAMSTNNLEWNRESKAEEVPTNLRPAEPPVKRPPGPDVDMVASNISHVPGQPNTVPMQEPEWIKRQREAQAQAYQAALNSGTEITNTVVPRQPAQQQQASAPMPTVNGTIPPPPPGYGGEGGEPPVDPAEQAQQRAFLAAFDPNASPYLKHAKNPPISPFEIKAGSVIPGVMVSGINSQLPGQCTGQVKSDVYDSSTGQHLLIPAGSKAICTYDSAINSGQEYIFVAWTRIIFPDGSSITLDSMPGANQSGIAGFKDQVNNHYARTFGQAFLLSLFSAGIQLSQPRGAVQGTYNAQQIGAAAIGQQLGMLGMQIARRNLMMQPTLEIRPGFEFTIAVNKDMVLPPWQGHPMARNVAVAGN
jgi:type IV secretion system protein VirB10